MQYSALKQINKTNVSKLQLAFFYPAPGPSGRFAFSPLIVDDVMFVVGKDATVNRDRRRHREAAVVAYRRGRADQPRLQLLGKQGSIGSAADLCRRQLHAGAQRARPARRSARSATTAW